MGFAQNAATVTVLLLLTQGCEGPRGYIYNMTSCPIELRTWVGAINGQSEKVAPGAYFNVFDFGVSYDHIFVRDVQGIAHDYPAEKLTALRPWVSLDDRWGYFEHGLSFMTDRPSQSSIDQLAASRCNPN